MTKECEVLNGKIRELERKVEEYECKMFNLGNSEKGKVDRKGGRFTMDLGKELGMNSNKNSINNNNNANNNNKSENSQLRK